MEMSNTRAFEGLGFGFRKPEVKNLKFYFNFGMEMSKGKGLWRQT